MTEPRVVAWQNHDNLTRFIVMQGEEVWMKKGGRARRTFRTFRSAASAIRLEWTAKQRGLAFMPESMFIRMLAYHSPQLTVEKIAGQFEMDIDAVVAIIKGESP